MTEMQLLHAKSIARHMLDHIRPYVRRLEFVQDIKSREAENIPVDLLRVRFDEELDNLFEELNSVRNDMLGDL